MVLFSGSLLITLTPPLLQKYHDTNGTHVNGIVKHNGHHRHFSQPVKGHAFVGAGVLHKYGADLFFPSARETECSNRFWCADFRCADFCADFANIFARMNCAQIFAQVVGAQICPLIFAQILRRCFGALKTGIPESRKNPHNICTKICGVPLALPCGCPIPSLLS